MYDEELPEDAVKYFTRRIKFSMEDLPIPAGRYHNFVDFMKFPSFEQSRIVFKESTGIISSGTKACESVFRVIKQKDILLSFLSELQPYH